MTDDIAFLAEPPTRIRYRIIVWLSVAAVLAYFCRNSVGVAESTIRKGLDFSESESGWFLGAFFWTYALFQVPAGALGKRYGTRIVLGCSAVFWSLGIALTGLATNLPMLILAQALMGLAQAAVFPCAVQSVSVWVPKTRRASFCAALTIGMQIGAIITAFLTGLLIKQWDWRIVFLAYSAPGILWAVGFFLRFHNHPSEDASVNSAERRLIDERPDEDSSSASNRDPNSEPLAWFQILTNRSILCLCGQQMFRAAGYSFFAAWFPSFLQETRHVKIEKSAFLQGTIFTATLFGGLLGGMLVDRIYHRTGSLRWSRSGVGGSCMLICGLLIFCAYFAESADAAVLLLALAAFTAALAGPCAYVTTIDLGKEHVSSVFGLMNMMGNLAAAATPVAIGYLFGYTKDWNIVLALFALAYVLAAVCWALVDPGQTLSPSEILQDEDL